MKIVSYLSVIVLSVFFIASCSKVAEPVKEIGLGTRVINYQESENVDSLVIPPDLTNPASNGIFSEEYEVDSASTLFEKAKNVEVIRDKYRRWLLVDLPPSDVWALTKEFLRSYGFKIEKENRDIGVFETEYLEIETKVPEKSLGAIRSALSKALKTQYGLPIADKYRVRVESTNNPMESEVYLTLSSIGEVTNGAMKVWQPREKDIEIETEMLLKLMVFLGSSQSSSIDKIQNADLLGFEIEYKLKDNNYPVLVFPFSREESWKMLGWAIDELGIDVYDRDIADGSFFIKIEPDRGFFTKLINTVGSIQTYQLVLKEQSNSKTELIFVDLSEENSTDTIKFSVDLFGQIAEQF